MNRILNEIRIDDFSLDQPLEQWKVKIERGNRNGTLYAILECRYEGEDYILELPMKKIHNDGQKHN